MNLGDSVAARPLDTRYRTPHIPEPEVPYPDLADIKGQETAKRALEIAVAVGHNTLER